MIAMIEITYGGMDRLKALSRDEWEALRQEMPQMLLTEWVEGKDRPYPLSYGRQIMIDMLSHGPRLASLGIGFEVKNFRGSYNAAGQAGSQHTHLHIAVAQLSLLSIGEVQTLENPDARDVQRELNDGWRILGVFPYAYGDTISASFWMGRSKGDA